MRTVACLATVVLIAACGSTSPTGSTSPAGSVSPAARGSNPTDSTLTFSKCMRANGVPSFPDIDPRTMHIQSTQGPNGQTISVNGVSFDAPAFRAARQSCQKYLPHGYATPAQSAQARQRGLEFARCMRSHGVPNFPDPKVISSSGGNQQVYLPGVNTQSPAVQAGAKACGFGPKGP